MTFKSGALGARDWLYVGVAVVAMAALIVIALLVFPNGASGSGKVYLPIAMGFLSGFIVWSDRKKKRRSAA